jgi:hypothetical protein
MQQRIGWGWWRAVLAAAWLGGAVGAAEKPVDFTLTAPGQVSLALYDTAGRMVRELRRAEPLPAGDHRVPWDGLDLEGSAVAPGTYVWRLLRTSGLRSEYLMSVGTSLGAQHWPGNHGGPTSIAAAGGSFLVAAATEGPPEVIRCTYEGQVVWQRGSFEPARNPRDLAVGGDRVYYLQDSGKIQVLDFATGASVGQPLAAQVPVATLPLTGLDFTSAAPQEISLPLPDGDYQLRFHHGDPERATGVVEVQPGGLTPWPGHRTLPDKMAWWQLPAAAPGTAKPIFLPQIYRNPRAVPVRGGRLTLKFIPQAPAAGQAVYWRADAVEVLALPDCVAANADTLVVASQAAAAVAWLDPATGVIRQRVELAGVRDLELAADGRVLALLADGVVAVTPAGVAPEPLLTGLAAPLALASAGADGGLYVLHGSDHQQVCRYDAQGRLLATFGRAGGRRFGRYEPKDLAGVSALAADGQGGVLVTERFGTPRRTVRLNAAGEVVQEWFGGMDFYAQTEFDPADPTIGWLRQDAEHLVRVRLDFDRRTWYPLAAYRWTAAFDSAGRGNGDPIFSTRLEYGPWLQRNPSHQRMRVLRRDLQGDGRTELLIEFTAQPLLLVHDEARDALRPLAAMGMVSRRCFTPEANTPTAELPPAWVEAMRQAGGDPDQVRQRLNYARYNWADEDGDGQITAAELRLGPVHRDASAAASAVGGHCLRMGPDLSAWIGPGHTAREGLYLRYRPERYTACGAPVWPLTPERGPLTARRGAPASLLPARDGGLYLLLHGNGEGYRARYTYDPAAHGWAWPGVTLDAIALLRLDEQGQRVWQSGYKAARWPHPRGQLHGAWHLLGEAYGCIVVNDWFEQPCEFWTTDGLYVGGLFDGRNGRDGSLPGGPPDRLYTWLGTKAKRIGVNDFHEHSPLAADDLRTGGAIAALPDGSVIYLGQGGNNNPCYRITGFTGWTLQAGTVTLAAPATPAAGRGTGLAYACFATPELTGEPLVLTTAAQVWYDNTHPWPVGSPPADFGARWTGRLEPRFSEAYGLSLYARGEVRLWVADQEVAWAEQDYPRDRELTKRHSVPIALTAGQPVPIRLEYRAIGTAGGQFPGPALHLNWESLSQPVEHIPTAFLYSP